MKILNETYIGPDGGLHTTNVSGGGTVFTEFEIVPDAQPAANILFNLPDVSKTAISINAITGEVTIPSLTASFDEEYIFSTYIIGTNNTWEDTGLKITLPAIGTYLMYVVAPVSLQANGTTAALYGRLYNITTSAVVANSASTLAKTIVSNVSTQVTATLQSIVTTASTNNVIRFEAEKVPGLLTATASVLYNSGTNEPRIGFTRLK